MRVAGIYASHHLSEMIDEDDIAQAARFLLGIDYPPRRYGYAGSVFESTIITYLVVYVVFMSFSIRNNSLIIIINIEYIDKFKLICNL